MTDPLLNLSSTNNLAVQEPPKISGSETPSAEELQQQFEQPSFEKTESSKETIKELSAVEVAPEDPKPGDIFENIYSYVRDKFPLHFAILTSASHLVSAFLGIKNFDSKAREFMDKLVKMELVALRIEFGKRSLGLLNRSFYSWWTLKIWGWLVEWVLVYLN